MVVGRLRGLQKFTLVKRLNLKIKRRKKIAKDRMVEI
jgi:hypothetical protein